MAENLGNVHRGNSHLISWIIVAFIVVILLAQATLLIMLPQPNLSRTSQEVTIVGVPWNKYVPMYREIGEGEHQQIQNLVSGTICKSLNSPVTTDTAGTKMSFYYLECNGIAGYVRASQVQE